MFASRSLFWAGATLLFIGSVAATIHGCVSMTSMTAMPMPGGWTMSMAWMRMPGQGWFESVAVFLGMWIAMMVAMMLPVLVPMLWRYRIALDSEGKGRSGRLIALAGLGYFCVWTALGAAVYPPGIALATLLMQQPALASAVPVATAVVVVCAGALQFTAWKARLLACCRLSPAVLMPASAGMAWRRGVSLGLHCVRCCAGQTAVLLVVGVMDWRAMIAVTAAIAAERLAPAGNLSARMVGVAGIGFGGWLLMRAVMNPVWSGVS
jgi:predicted metal-binding membrane protein